MKPLELTLRSQVGAELGLNELDCLAGRAEELLNSQMLYAEKIGRVLADTVSNFGSSASAGADYIISQLKERQRHGN